MAHARGAPRWWAGGRASNERLEFLGDAVLGWVVADWRSPATGTCPRASSRISARASSTRRRSPRWRCDSTSALSAPRQGRGRGRRPSQAVDPLRRAGSVIGAVYVDGGSEAASPWWSAPSVRRCTGSSSGSTTRPQDVAAGTVRPRPGIGAGVRAARRGDRDHEKTFHAIVKVGGRELGRGSGRSKKIAEQAAAAEAYRALSAAVAEQAARPPSTSATDVPELPRSRRSGAVWTPGSSAGGSRCGGRSRAHGPSHVT